MIAPILLDQSSKFKVPQGRYLNSNINYVVTELPSAAVDRLPGTEPTTPNGKIDKVGFFQLKRFLGCFDPQKCEWGEGCKTGGRRMRKYPRFDSPKISARRGADDSRSRPFKGTERFNSPKVSAICGADGSRS